MASAEAPIVVIGGGIGGLSAAVRLAAAGRRVILFEQNPALGGKMAEVVDRGFRWDTGPSVITMRHVLDDLFQAAGEALDDHVTLRPIEPLTRYFFPDGATLDLTSDWQVLAGRIAELDPRDVEGYLRFLALAAALYRITGPVFIDGPPPRLRDLLRVPPRDMLKALPLRTLQQEIERHVYSPHMRQLLGRFATYVGASPYAAPSTLAVIAHVELSAGVWYPEGGIYRIAAALEALARRLGVEIHTNAGVSQIRLDGNRVAGVATVGGETVSASAVVANVDVITVYRNLLSDRPEMLRHVRGLLRRRLSCSGFALLLGVRGCRPRLSHHNIFFSADYRQEFQDIFAAGRPPADPTIYVAITSKTNPDHAPPDHENWFVLVNAPPLSAAFDWATQAQTYRDSVLKALGRYGLDVAADVVAEHHITPQTLAGRTGAWQGALYGISSNETLNALRRPHNRARGIRGLYFAGGTTHPGGGVPMVALSGKVAAEMLLADYPAAARTGL